MISSKWGLVINITQIGLRNYNYLEYESAIVTFLNIFRRAILPSLQFCRTRNEFMVLGMCVLWLRRRKDLEPSNFVDYNSINLCYADLIYKESIPYPSYVAEKMINE